MPETADVVYLVVPLAPVMVRAARARVGFEVLRDRLPGSTVAGAVASALGIKGAEELALKGEYVFSDAYPAVRGGGGPRDVKPSQPASPACFKLKSGAELLCGSKLRPGVYCIPSAPARADRDPAHAVQEALERLSEYCGAPVHVLAAPAELGRPIVFEEVASVGGVSLAACSEVPVESFVEWRDSVAMSVWLGRGEEGMLFSYEALKGGLAWWGAARVPSGLLPRLAEGVIVRVGGGRGRGFGWAVLVAEQVDYQDLLREPLSEWMLLWSPLPVHLARQALDKAAPRERALMWLASRSSDGRARITVRALAPGSLVRPKTSARTGARFAGLRPPWGSAEPLSVATGRAPSLEAAEKVLGRLWSKAEEVAASWAGR